MKGFVVYVSKYGSTKILAEHIAQQLGIETRDVAQVQNEMFAEFDYIILATCIMEGKFSQFEMFANWMRLYPEKHWVLVTSGLGNPKHTNFAEILAQYVDSEMQEKIVRFHFRSAIRYKRLEFVECLCKRWDETPVESLDYLPLGDWERGLLEHYGTTHDDELMTLVEPVVLYIRSLEEE